MKFLITFLSVFVGVCTATDDKPSQPINLENWFDKSEKERLAQKERLNERLATEKDRLANIEKRLQELESIHEMQVTKPKTVLQTLAGYRMVRSLLVLSAWIINSKTIENLLPADVFSSIC